MHELLLPKNLNVDNLFPVHALSENKLNKLILLSDRISSIQTTGYHSDLKTSAKSEKRVVKIRKATAICCEI